MASTRTPAPPRPGSIGASPRSPRTRVAVRGAGRYVGDLRPPGCLEAHFVRSYLAHGEIVAVDAGPARAQPGVLAAFAAADLPELPAVPGGPLAPFPPEMARPALAREKVRFVGEPLAVVVASDRYLAEDAAEEVVVSLEPLPSLVDPRRAADAAAPLLFPPLSNVVATRSHGADVADVLATAPVVVEVAVTNQRVSPLSIEPRAIVVAPDGGDYHVWCSHQAPHRLRAALAAAFDLPAERVRVTAPDVGGAFGAKSQTYPEYLVVFELARRLGRPVRWCEDRTEALTAATHGRGQHARVRLAAEPDGKLLAADIELVADLGGYPDVGLHLPGLTALVASGPYRIPRLSVRTTAVITTTAPVTSYRGAGRPEAAYALERAMAELGRRLELDPAELRRRNFVAAEDHPYVTPTGAVYDSGRHAAALDLALERGDYAGWRAEQRRRRAAPAAGSGAAAAGSAAAGGSGAAADTVTAAGSGVAGRAGAAEAAGPLETEPPLPTGVATEPLLGIGVASWIERTGGAAGSSEYALAEVTADGRVVGRLGTSPQGQGHDATFAQLLADALELPWSAVEIVAGDTALVARGTGAFASRSTQVGGSALWRAGEALLAAARERAAARLGVPSDELAYRAGRFEAVGAGASAGGDGAVELTELGPLAAEGSFESPQAFPFGSYLAVVEVDPGTGVVTVLRLVAVDDCGVRVNPGLVEGQVIGSIAQGIGQALYEGVRYDEAGQPLTASLLDYTIPTAGEMPALELPEQVTPAPEIPTGVKGAGESGCIGAPPAVVTAVLDALADYDCADLQMPLTPEAVLACLRRPRDRVA